MINMSDLLFVKLRQNLCDVVMTSYISLITTQKLYMIKTTYSFNENSNLLKSLLPTIACIL